MYKESDKIFVTITKAGYIPKLGMCGPIPNPIKITTATALSLVKSGVDVFEVNPETKENIKITMSNVFDSNKFAAKEVKAVVTKKEEKVVVPTPEVTLGGVVDTKVNEKVVEETPVVDEVQETEEAPLEEEKTEEETTNTNTNYKKKKKK